jgi:hypothetical protein
MQSVDYEKVLEGYLLNDRGTPVTPQFYVIVNGIERWIDVVAVRGRERTIYFAEITESTRPNKL